VIVGALPLAGSDSLVDEVVDGKTSFNWRLSAIDARREPFFALEDSAVRALVVEVEVEKIWVYASISAGEGGSSCSKGYYP
jgi:hypothetical protein